MRGLGDPSAAAAREDRLDGPEILLRVHAHGGLGGLEHPDRDAVLEQSELLEASPVFREIHEHGLLQQVVAG